MARLILICFAGFLLLASPRIRAEQLKFDQFPVSDERMAALIELAADGSLTIPDAAAPNWAAIASQVSFLRQVIYARKMVSLGHTTGAYPAERCYRAVMAARAGNYYAANLLLEGDFSTGFDSYEYCSLLYRHWNGNALSYRFLRWWAKHVSGPDFDLGMVMLMAAGQLLALPLLLKLRHAIKARRRGLALIGPALAAAFAEAVPLCWAVANGPAWAFAYDIRNGHIVNVALSAHAALFVMFVFCSRGMSAAVRTSLATALLLFGMFLSVLPLFLLRKHGLISGAGAHAGVIFWSAALAVAIYFLILFTNGLLRRYVLDLGRGVMMKFAPIPAGEFRMGSPESEAGRYPDEMQHTVKLTKSFYMQTTPVTQAQWQAVMGYNASYFHGGDFPVEKVSWNDAVAFCRRLSLRHSKHFRLPTEAEWEYACRGGTQTPFAGTGNLDEMGWYAGNSNHRSQRVARKKANAWNLHDMHGNVRQWCSDGYGPYAGDAVDPAGSNDGSSRVLRGGSWDAAPAYCRAASRNRNAPDFRRLGIGLRLCLDLSRQPV